MNYQAGSKSAGLACLTIIAVAIFVVSFLATASLNPFAVYASGSVVAKIIVTILAGLLALSFIQGLIGFMLRKSVEIGTGKPAEDLICPGCGLPLMQYAGSHGIPIVCPKCEVPWHDGPACYRKGMPLTKAIIPFYPCPRCRSAASDNRDLFEEADISNV